MSHPQHPICPGKWAGVDEHVGRLVATFSRMQSDCSSIEVWRKSRVMATSLARVRSTIREQYPGDLGIWKKMVHGMFRAAMTRG